MPNLTSLEFEALDISGDNYLAWALDAEIHLSAKELGETIKEGNKAESKDKAKAMIFLRHHLHEGLKSEARYDWTHLRLQDFKSVSEYNSALFKITSKLELCGEKVTDADMLEKTFSTFHANNVVLQTQYREKGFQKYSQLISCLLVAEQNNELLMKNHGLRPTGSAPFPEANATSYDRKEQNHRGQGHIRGRGRGGRGRGRGRDFGVRQRGNDHWARLCRTPKHLVGLYQQAVKEKGKNVETNLVYEDGEDDLEMSEATHMEIADILAPEGNMRI
ncbi:unnamed protein product [Microthlaspi erraticum]|uniref:Uncharacterized protein n=1 Tax=Microthlaspi erraticum TaxID=1685480 RepID=A0A6D2LLI9_9BRAS|nr:unnamed protein product [Microthlaspi erraticum]